MEYVIQRCYRKEGRRQVLVGHDVIADGQFLTQCETEDEARKHIAMLTEADIRSSHAQAHTQAEQETMQCEA